MANKIGRQACFDVYDVVGVLKTRQKWEGRG